MGTRPREPRPVAVHRSIGPSGPAEHATRAPHPALAGSVVRATGYDLRVPSGAVHLGLPTTSLPLVISFGEPQTIAAPDGSSATVGSFATGVHVRGARITAERFHGIQVDLTPLGAVQLLGRPLTELVDRCVALEDLFGRAEVERLTDRMASAPDWATRFDLLDAALLARLAAARPSRPELRWAYQQLDASGGRVEVQRLAAELGWSRRHLSGHFTGTIGVPPKRLGRLIRFERTLRWLVRADRPGLARVAAATGYSDQAHLTREVRAFTGLPPRELVARYGPDDGWWER